MHLFQAFEAVLEVLPVSHRFTKVALQSAGLLAVFQGSANGPPLLGELLVVRHPPSLGAVRHPRQRAPDFGGLGLRVGVVHRGFGASPSDRSATGAKGNAS